MAKAAREQTVTVDGRLIKLTNLDKVLYPQTHTTKADVLAYYAEVGPTMLPHLYERPATRKRWPDGVGSAASKKAPTVFFNKDLTAGTPDWVARHKIAHKDHDNYYPVVNDLATLTWLAQLAALEIHVPQWRFGRNGQPRNPDRLVLDLDPGPGVSLAECAEIALLARDILRDIGHDPVPVTSGSKGIHLYAPLDGSQSPEQATAVARELALALEADHRDRVISSMKRSERDGKVFVDWSQNNGAKTTVAPYSLRGRDRPMVAAPRTWEELASPDLEQLDYATVLDRVRELGDPLAALADPEAPGTRTPDRLATYRSMRDAAKTPEPVPAEPAGGRARRGSASSSRSTTPGGCTTTSGWSATASWSAGRCRRRPRPTPRSTIWPCRPRTTRWSTPPSRAPSRAGSTAAARSPSGTRAPTSCTSGGRARR